MGLREKVTLILVIIALIQIACRHCMPRTPRKASLKRYLNNLKPVKNNPAPTPYSPSRINKIPKKTFVKAARNGKISETSSTKQSLFKTYNFPENEYPLDISPKDPFNYGINFNRDYQVNTPQKESQCSAINDMKKEMKMKRKLLSNKQVNNENSQLKNEMSSIKFASGSDSIYLLDSATFPEVQYPLNTMETWVPNYWNHLVFTEEDKQFDGFGLQAINSKVQDVKNPVTRLTKAKASQFLKPYDKLKEEQRRTSTENSKRSNVGDKGLNFTKTATCERVSEDFMTASMVSSIPKNTSDAKKTLESTETIPSSENTCSVTEYLFHLLPIPYKVIEEDIESICPVFEQNNNTQELKELNNTITSQTLELQPVQDIPFKDDTNSTIPLGNFSKDIEKDINTSNYTDVPVNEDTVKNNAIISPAEELSLTVPSDAPTNILENNISSALPAETSENSTIDTGSLNVEMLLQFAEPKTDDALTNVPSLDASNMKPFSSGNAVPASTSIIIIPINNNAVGTSQSHMFRTTPDTQIIVYIPSTQSSDNPSLTLPHNQYISSSLDKIEPNNQLRSILSNKAPLQNENPTFVVSELLNGISNSGSSLPMYEKLPTNPMCYNNENGPSIIKEKSFLDNPIQESLTHISHPATPSCDNKLLIQPTTWSFDTLPSTPDFEHTLFNFPGNDLTVLSHGPYNNIFNHEFPIARKIDSDQQISNVSSKELFFQTYNVTSNYLHNNVSDIYLQSSMNNVPKAHLSKISEEVLQVELDKRKSSETHTGSLEILKNNAFVFEPLPDSFSVPMQKTHTPTSISKKPVDSLLVPINKNLPLTSLPGPITDKLPTIDKALLPTSTVVVSPLPANRTIPVETTLSHTPDTLSDKLPLIIDEKVPTTPFSNTTSAPKSIDKSPSPNSIRSPILHNSQPALDKTLKPALLPESFKDRLLLDRMIPPSNYPTNSLPLMMNKTLPAHSDTDNPPLTINKPQPSSQTSANSSLVHIDKNLSSTSLPDFVTDSLSVTMHDKMLDTSTVGLLLPTDKSLSPSAPYETLSHKLIMDKGHHPIAVSNTITKSVPQPIDPSSIHPSPSPSPIFHSSRPVIDKTLKPTLAPESFKDKLLLDKMLPAPETIPESLPTIMDKTLAPISSYDSFPLSIKKALLQINPTDSLPLSVEKKVESFPILGTPIDSLRPQIDKTLPAPPIFDIPADSLPPPMTKSLIPASILDTTDILPRPIDTTLVHTPVSETSTGNRPYVIDNLVTPLSNTVTSRTKDPSEHDLTITMDDIPLKMDLVSDLYKFSSEDIPVPVEDLPLTVHQNAATNPLTEVSTNDYTTQTDKIIPTSHSEDPNDMLSLTSELPLPENKMSDMVSPGLPMEELLKEYPLYNSPSDSLPSLPVDTFISQVSEKLSDRKIPSLKYDLPVSVNKATDKSANSGAHSEDPLSLLADPFTPDLSLSNAFTNEPLPVDDSPSPVTDDFSSPDNKIVQLPDNETDDQLLLKNKTPSTSKLPITKKLLENVLSGITKEGFSSPVAKALPVTPQSQIKKTIYYVDEESPLSENKNSTPLLVDKILPNTTLSDDPTNNLPYPVKTENNSLPIDKTFSNIPKSNIFTVSLSPIDEKFKEIPDIPTNDVKDQDNNETPFSDKPHPNDMPSENLLTKTRTTSASKLPITKTLLKNVLTDITTKGVSLPKAVPVTSPSELDKTLYYEEPPLSDITKSSPPLLVDKVLPNIALPNHPNNDMPLSLDETVSNVPSLDPLTQFDDNTNCKDEISPDMSDTKIFDSEQGEKKNTSPENSTDDLSTIKKSLLFSNDMPRDLPLPKNKTPSASKLPITKALLQTVLSDITTKGFLLPKAVPLTSPSVLDETPHYIESRVSDITKDSPPLLVDKVFPNHPNNDLPSRLDETVSNIPSLDIPTQLDDNSIGKDEIRPDIPDDNNFDQKQDKNETSSSVYFNDDLSPMDEILPFPNDMPGDLPLSQQKTSSASKLPITNHPNNDMPLALDETDLHIPSLDSPTQFDDNSKGKDEISPDMCDTKTFDSEQGQKKNTSKKTTDDLPPIKKSLPFSNDMPRHLPLPKTKTPSASTLPITKNFLENVLSDINTGGFSLSKADPLTSPSVLDKTPHYIGSPVSDITKDSPPLLVDNVLLNTELPNPSNNDLPSALDETVSNFPSLDPPTEFDDKSKGEDEISPDMPDTKTFDSEQGQKKNTSSKKTTDDLPQIKKSLPFSYDMPRDLPLPKNKTLSASKLPITKTLLENVLSDLNTKGFSLSNADPLTSPSVLDKTSHYIGSPVSDITKDSPPLLVDKVLPNTELSNHPNNDLPSALDETISNIPTVDIPTELDNNSKGKDEIRPGMPDSKKLDPEHGKNKISSLKNSSDDLSPMGVTPFVLKDISGDQSLPEHKTPSASKLPVTKALLENVLSDITTRGFSLPKPVPVILTSELDKALYDKESPLSDITKSSPPLLVDKVFPKTAIPNHPNNGLPLASDETVSYIPRSNPFTEFDDYSIGKDEIRPFFEPKPSENKNPSFENPDDLSPMNEILPIINKMSGDQPLPKTKTPSATKLPITKALLETVLSDITTKGFSLPTVIPLTSPSVLDKTPHYVESPVSNITEDSPPMTVTDDKTLPSITFPDHPTDDMPLVVDTTLPNTPNLDIPTELHLLMDIPYILIYDPKQDKIENLSDLSTTKETFSILPGDLPLLNQKTPTVSKLPITKALLETVLSDITTKGLSLPKAVPITSPSVLEKMPIPPVFDITENSPLLPVDKTLPSMTIHDHPNEDMLLNTHSLDIPTELPSRMDHIQPDVPDILIFDPEKDKNLSDELSPMNKTLSIPKDMSGNLSSPKHKTPTDVTLPITRAILENVLTDITTRGFSISTAIPVALPSVLDKTLYYIDFPLADITEDNRPLSIDKVRPSIAHSDYDDMALAVDKTLSNTPGLDIPTKLPSLMEELPDIPDILIFDPQKGKNGKLSDDLSPMTETLFIPKDMPGTLSLPKHKTPKDAKLPITKAILENVLSDITTRGFSLLKAVPVTSPLVLDKTPHYLMYPVSDFTEESPPLLMDKILPSIAHSNHLTDDMPLAVDKTLPNTPSLDFAPELLPLMDEIQPDIPNILMFEPEQDKTENLSDDLSSMNETLLIPKDIPGNVPLPKHKTPTDATLSITKAILENVLTDITTRGYSIPNDIIPVASPSLLDKTLYYIDFPLTDITEDIRPLSVDKVLPSIAHSDHLTGDMPLALDGTVSNNPSLDPPMEFDDNSKDVISPDMLDIKMFDPEQDKNKILSSENSNGDLSPIDKILSIPNDMPGDLSLPKNKTPSTLKLPMTKALLETVLSDITTKGFSLPKAFPVTSPSVLEKEPHNIESPASDMTEDLPSISKDMPGNLPLPKHKTPTDATLPITKAILENVLTDITTRGFSIPKAIISVASPSVLEDSRPLSVDNFLPSTPLSARPNDDLPFAEDKTVLGIPSSDIPRDLSSQMDEIDPVVPDNLICQEQVNNENLSSRNPSDDLSAIGEIFSYSNDLPGNLPSSQNKISSASKLPIAKALLENVLGDINTRGLSFPVAKASEESHSQLDKTPYSLKSPVSDMTEQSLPMPTDKALPDLPTDHFQSSELNKDADDKAFPDDPILNFPTDELPMDKIHQDKSVTMIDYIKDEHSNEYLSSDHPTDDFSSQTDKKPSLTEAKSGDPLTLAKPHLASRIPTTKALLEKVLTDITEGGFSS